MVHGRLQKGGNNLGIVAERLKPIDTLQMMASYKGGNIHHSHPLDGTKEDVDPKHIEIMQLADPQNESARRRAEIQAIAPDSQNYR